MKYYILFFLFYIFILNNNNILYGNSVISPTCQNDVNLLLQNQYPNASIMVESCGLKMNDLGNIDQCLSLASNVSQYCIYQNVLQIGTYSDTYYVGVCYPASCSVQDVINLVPKYSLSPGGSTPLVHCYSSDDLESANRKITKPAIGLFIFSGIIVLLIIIGTTIDYIFYHNKEKRNNTSSKRNSISVTGTSFRQQEEVSLLDGGNSLSINNNENRIFTPSPPIWIKFFLGFSFIKNFKSFVTIYPNGSNTTTIKEIDSNGNTNSTQRIYFDCLDGIRTLSMFWVVLGHSLLFNATVGYDNTQELYSAFKGFSFQIIPAGAFAVDIFFMLSGFLVCHGVLKQLTKNPDQVKSIKFWALYVIHRFIRLSPLYYYVLLLFVYVGPLLEYGPLTYLYNLDEVIPSCQNNLLPNFFYYNNMENNPAGECYAVSWYLANDFQFYIVAIFIFIFYRYNKKLGWFFMSLILVFTITIGIAVSYHFKIQPFFSLQASTTPGSNFNLTDIYERPWFRIGPYIVGLAYAFLFNEHSSTLQRIYKNKLLRYIIYFLSFSLTFILTFTPYSYYKGSGWNLTQTSLWNGFSHTVFPLGVGGFMLASFYGYGGILKYFLELPVFKILSKLTYSIYLCHMLVLLIRVMSTTVLFHYSWIEYTYTYSGNLLCSVTVAFIFHMAIEKPFINIERLIFNTNN